MKKILQDTIGDIVILKFQRKTPNLTKKLKAMKFLKENKNIKTVLEKTDKISGKLRIQKTNYLVGIKTKEAVYRENECLFKFNIDETYFSPRLSNERKIIAEEISKIVKKNSKILVMFSGVAPYPVVIAKKLKQKKIKAKITANELNKKANIYAQKNINLNKLEDYITLEKGDARKLKGKFDIILMPRPNLKETFLEKALNLSRKKTTIFYYGFGTKEKVINEIKKDAKNKIGKITIRRAGDIGPYVYRWQAKFKVK